MAVLSGLISFENGDVINANEVNSNFTTVKNFVETLSAGGNFDAGAIGTEDIATAAITEGKIAIDAVTASKLASNSVTTAKIDDGAVTTAKIADNAVTQAKLADRAVGSAELDNITFNAQTGTTYTIVLSDAQKLVTLTNASAITVTVPLNSTSAFEIGDQVNLLQLGAGQVTVSPAGGVTIRSEGSRTKIRAQYGLVTLVKIGTDEWVLIGNTAA